MPDTENQPPVSGSRGKAAAAAAGIALLAIGGGVGAAAMQATRPSVTMAPATPVAIKSLQSDGIVTIKGHVTEIFGNKFIVQDQSGRALVETGLEGEDGKLVTMGEPVTVQGRFDRGFVRAAFLIGADTKVLALGPLGGRRGDQDRHGGRLGPESGLDGPPLLPPTHGDEALSPAEIDKTPTPTHG